MRKYIILISCMFLLASCAPIPHTTEVSPTISGVVIDSESSLPIADAVIKYSRGLYSDSTVSDKDGKFVSEPLSQWHYLVYMGSPGHVPSPDRLEYMRIPAKLEITANGYEAKAVQIRIDKHVGDDKLPEGIDFDITEKILIELKHASK